MRLLVDGSEAATGTAATLPDRLPPLGSTPFICLVGSCFAHYNDAAGAAGAAYRALPAGARPDVKFLCGDQIYLDAPFPRYLLKVLEEKHLGPELLATYLSTWAQGGDGRGFHEVLRTGANYFGSDDHEVWNNAPLPTATVRATWWPFGDHGAAWLRFATALYDQFQTPTRSLAIQGRAAVVLRARHAAEPDGRSRHDSAARTTSPASVSGSTPWTVRASSWSGSPSSSRRRGVGGLPDRLRARRLHASTPSSCARSCVRRTTCWCSPVTCITDALPGAASRAGRRLSRSSRHPSPWSTPRVGGKWHRPPLVFPAVAVPGTTQAATWFEAAHDLATNQFATLEFSADGSRVLASVRAWPIPNPGSMPTSRLVFQQPLS